MSYAKQVAFLDPISPASKKKGTIRNDLDLTESLHDDSVIAEPVLKPVVSGAISLRGDPIQIRVKSPRDVRKMIRKTREGCKNRFHNLATPDLEKEPEKSRAKDSLISDDDEDEPEATTTAAAKESLGAFMKREGAFDLELPGYYDNDSISNVSELDWGSSSMMLSDNFTVTSEKSLELLTVPKQQDSRSTAESERIKLYPEVPHDDDEERLVSKRLEETLDLQGSDVPNNEDDKSVISHTSKRDKYNKFRLDHEIEEKQGGKNNKEKFTQQLDLDSLVKAHDEECEQEPSFGLLLPPLNNNNRSKSNASESEQSDYELAMEISKRRSNMSQPPRQQQEEEKNNHTGGDDDDLESMIQLCAAQKSVRTLLREEEEESVIKLCSNQKSVRTLLREEEERQLNMVCSAAQKSVRTILREEEERQIELALCLSQQQNNY